MMDTFIELTATIRQNFLFFGFLSGFWEYKFKGIKRFISFGIIFFPDC